MNSDVQALMAVMVPLLIIVLIIAIIMIVSMWKLFEKAGKPGWAAIVPIYNTVVMLEIIKKPIWWLFLMMIPYVGIIWSIWAMVLFVKSFGKSTGYAVACIFVGVILLPMMAFSSETQFVGAATDTGEMMP